MQQAEQEIEFFDSIGKQHTEAFFLYAKAQLSNSTAYNYSSRRLAKHLKMSHNVVNYHVQALDKLGYIRHTGKNITFVRPKIYTDKGVEVKHSCSIKVNKSDTICEIKKKIQFKIAEKVFRHQEKIISEKEDARLLNNPNVYLSTQKIKSIYKKIKGNPSLRESPITKQINIGNKKLAHILNVSVRQVVELKKYWKKIGLIDYSYSFVRICKAKGFDKEAMPQYFCHKGWLYHAEPTKYTVLSYYPTFTDVMNGKKMGVYSDLSSFLKDNKGVSPDSVK